jgi:hypothetical protein
MHDFFGHCKYAKVKSKIAIIGKKNFNKDDFKEFATTSLGTAINHKMHYTAKCLIKIIHKAAWKFPCGVTEIFVNSNHFDTGGIKL